MICSVNDCEKSTVARGLCDMHYRRLRRHGSTDDPRIPAEARFWAMVEKSEGCWTWTGSLTHDGYGRFKTGGVKFGAHRYAYQLTIGSIPEGMQIDHRCFNRACVRPDHLRAVTAKQNSEHQRLSRPNKSGVRGVSWDRGKWRVLVYHAGVKIDGGRYRELRDAEAAAIALRNQVFTHNDLDRIAG